MVFRVIYLTLFLSTNLMNTCHGNIVMDYSVDETLDRRKLQDERKGNLGNFQMKRKESFVVTPPFEHNVVTLDTISAEKEYSSWDDSVAQPDVRYTDINDKDGKTYDYEANVYRNYDYDALYNENIDNKAPYNISDEYPAENNMETLMDVLSKQNQMVEKLVELYHAEIGHKQFDKLIESINRKQYLQFLETKNGNIGRTENESNALNNETQTPATEANETTTTTTTTTNTTTNTSTTTTPKPTAEKDKDEEQGKKDDEDKQGQDLINTIIHFDQTLVKKKLANDPFVKRILRMAQKKKEQYMIKRKQELATATPCS